MGLSRRDFLKFIGVGAVGAAGLGAYYFDKDGKVKLDEDFYRIDPFGTSRIIHLTDTHGNLLPSYFREPNVNLGLAGAYNKLPHMVGHHFLKETGLQANTLQAHVFTYLDFEKQAAKYGKTGGFAQMKTVIDMLRTHANGRQNTLTVDGGDTWQGSGTSLWTQGQDMVEACNILGVDVMVGHWEFTYKEEQVLKNIGFFKGDFVGQNVRILEQALFGDDYIDMADRNEGRGLFNEDEALPFKPYVMKDVGGKRLAVVGQAFPRTSNANPQKYFFPDWSFGLREEEMATLVADIRDNEKPDAVILVSHNGMDVDLKMASRVSGIDAIFGGHTHDGVPKVSEIKNEGGTTLVMNAGCSGKFIGVFDMDIDTNGLKDYRYKMLPIVTGMIKPDAKMTSFIDKMRQKTYTKDTIEARNPKMANNANRVGKTYDAILTEKLCKTTQTLYRRGNFMGTWDQVLVNALREEYDSDFALSAGVRWGTSVPAGHDVTMEDLMANTATTYSETYTRTITGKAIKDMLEGVAENLFQKDPYLQSGGDMVRVGGLDYTIRPDAKLGERISDIKKDDGTPIKDTQTYTISGWAQVDTIGAGRLMWDVAADYLRKRPVLTLDKVNHPKILGVKGNPGMADYVGQWT